MLLLCGRSYVGLHDCCAEVLCAADQALQVFWCMCVGVEPLVLCRLLSMLQVVCGVAVMLPATNRLSAVSSDYVVYLLGG